MTSNWLKQTLLFFILILLQVLVLNNISFLGYATPFLYIYFIIKIPVGTNRNLIILLGFLLGLSIDLFCNTLGQHAAATVFASFIRNPIQTIFFSRDDFEHTIPSINTLGTSVFMRYASLIILIHHTCLISISSFSYLNVTTIILRILLSAILTSILVFAIEGFSIKKRKHE